MTFSAAGKLLAPFRTMSGSYGRAWRAAGRRQPYTVVLCYHRVVAEMDATLFNVERGLDAGLFERQMRFMLRYFQPIAADRAGEAPGASFAVTFDDGTLDNYEIAAPILDRLGIPGTFFVVQDFIGTDRLFWWEELGRMLRDTKTPALATRGLGLARDVSLPDTLALTDLATREDVHDRVSAAIRPLPPGAVDGVLDRVAAALDVNRSPAGRDFALMGWKELHDLARRGHAIGGHSATHANLGAATDEELEAEVGTATRQLEAAMGAPIRSFALPYGHRAQGDAEAILRRRTNVSAMFTTGGGRVTADADRFDLPRIQLNRNREFVWAYNVDAVVGRSAHQSPKIASA